MQPFLSHPKDNLYADVGRSSGLGLLLRGTPSRCSAPVAGLSPVPSSAHYGNGGCAGLSPDFPFHRVTPACIFCQMLSWDAALAPNMAEYSVFAATGRYACIYYTIFYHKTEIYSSTFM